MVFASATMSFCSRSRSFFKGNIKCADHNLLDLGPAEPVRRMSKGLQVEILNGTFAFTEVNGKRPVPAPAASGRSTKKISSKRPFRSISGRKGAYIVCGLQ